MKRGRYSYIVSTFLVVMLTTALHASDFCATFTPQPLKASELALGTGKDYGLWTVSIRPQFARPHISREAIMDKFPHGALFAWQAADVLDRKAHGNGRTRLKVYGGLALRLAPAALSAFGISTGTDWATFTGIGLGAASVVGERLAESAPDPGLTKSHLLPDTGISGMDDWSGLIVTGIITRAAKIGPVCDEDFTPIVKKTTVRWEDYADIWRLAVTIAR